MQTGTKTDNCGKNCSWRTTVKTCDLILRTDAIEAILGSFNAIRAIEELHAVDAVPVIHGRWEVCGDCGVTRCSVCKWNFEGHIDYKYCPNCGAKMDDDA